MILRWIHSIWNFLLYALLAVLLLVIVVVGGGLALLQMDASKQYLANRIERDFNRDFRGELEIEKLDGFIPFSLQAEGLRLFANNPDGGSRDTLLSVQSVDADIDVWGFLQNRIRISGFTVDNPEVTLAEGQSLRNALDRDRPASGDGQWLRTVEVLAPQVTIRDGRLWFEAFRDVNSRRIRLPQPFEIERFNATMFVELSREQRFLDIDQMYALPRGMNTDSLSVAGQLFSDSRFVEFNAFTIETRRSALQLNGEIDGIDLYGGALLNQLQNAHYRMQVQSEGFYPDDFADILPLLPAISDPVELDIETDGDLERMELTRFAFGAGDSYVSVNGVVNELGNADRLNYEFSVDDVFMRKQDVEIFAGNLEDQQYELLERLSVNGQVGGMADSLNADLDLSGPSGSVSLDGSTQLAAPYRYRGSLQGADVDLSDVFPSLADTTSLNFDASVEGMGFQPETAQAQLVLSVYEGVVDDYSFDRLDWNASLLDGFLEHNFNFASGEEEIDGRGWTEINTEDRPFALSGTFGNVDLARFFPNADVPQTALNLDYNFEIEGNTLDRLHGQANVDVRPSAVNGDTLRAHQLYADLSAPGLENRTFRFTSSMFDFELSGGLVPSEIQRQYRFWSEYITDRIRQEYLLDTHSDSLTIPDSLAPITLNGAFRAKDLSILESYYPAWGNMSSNARMEFEVNTDSTRLLVSGEASADSVRYENWELQNPSLRLTAGLRNDRSLKEFSRLDLESDFPTVDSRYSSLENMQTRISLRQDSLRLSHNIEQISRNAGFNLDLLAALDDSSLSVQMQDFFLGNDTYAWRNEGRPGIILREGRRAEFRDFMLRSGEEFLELSGTLSPNEEDSVLTVVENVDLERISELIDGRVDFRGVMEGELTSRSLTRSPTVQGRFGIEQLHVNDRLVGDVSFNSDFNRERNRFDSRISILTDSTKYGDYLEENDGIGQNIVMNGYFYPPEPAAERDTLYYFDTEFREIDLWPIAVISPSVLDVVEGRASGLGYLTGDMEDYDFFADFVVSNALVRPQFLGTNYFANGNIQLDREEGVVFDSLQVADTKGGSSRLWGSLDLNDFEPIKYLDLNWELDDIQFLNSEYDPEIPFYGDLSGTGLVRLSGPTNELYLRSTGLVEVSSNSRLSIPLLEETELNENTRFIRFVESFDDDGIGVDGNGEAADATASIDEILDDLTFTERFNVDLQFEAPDNVDVELIFDPVTGDILTASGTGQLRVTMQDEEVGMFGEYDVSGGEYQFVGGDIISRRLELEEGGSIIWEGDPGNSRLDIDAVYRARPNIMSLTSSSSGTDFSQGQRIPVELVLEITGTLNSVENDYYFRLPNTMDFSSNSILAENINSINRNEEEKLIQATSILLTGNFMNVGAGADEARTEFTRNFASGTLNPLLSSQVISPLLSNQINNLLNSDVSQFDVDFNLNAYNEIDLGVALRLYNDRLILRREGQITGAGDETTIGDRLGDLNATYRINRGLSVTAFHRQDQSIGSLTSTPGGPGELVPTIDGLGLETQFRFNRWNDFGDRIKQIFGNGIENDEEEENNSENDSLTGGEAIPNEEQEEN